MIGLQIGRYRIVARIGEGGMGVVWRAEDTLLGRDVALKFLSPELATSPEARQRFQREARAASRLEHPAIAAVYEVGEADGQLFIANQYIHGETLQSRVSGVSAPDAGDVSPARPLALHALLQLARGCAGALSHAHARSVLHRDLSARNIMLRPDGEPVIVDFGIALATGDARLTRTGTALGTVSYLAPEQWRGEPASERTDLWSIGVSLYLATTGRLPFPGQSDEESMYGTLNREPESPDRLRSASMASSGTSRGEESLPARFHRVLMRLLEKDPRDRFPSAEVLAAELADPTLTGVLLRGAATPAKESPIATMSRWWRRQARRRFGPVQVAGILLAAALLTIATWRLQRAFQERQERTIAVLPMRVAGGDSSEAGVIAEAFGEELVAGFRDVPRLRVLPWITSGRPEVLTQPLQRFAAETQSDFLLTGSITVGEGGSRVHAELVDGRIGTTVWSRDLAVSPEMFRDAQAQLVSGVIQRLMGSVPRGVRERLGRSMDRDPAAYELFIRGANAWHSTDPERQELAIPLLERAVELDSTLATAWVALGAARLDGIYRGIDADTALASVQRCFETAQRLEPGLPVVERGLIHLATETGGREQAEYVLEIAATALARDPHDVDQLTTAAWGFTQGGQADLAVPVIQRALRLDPGNRGLAWYRVLALAWAGMPFRCLASGAEFIRRYGEDAQVYACMGGANLKLRRFREAIPFLERAVELHGPGSWHYSKNVLVKAYRFAGDSAKFRAASREVIEELEMRLTGNPMNMRLLSGLATAYELAGDTHRLRSLLDPLTRDLSGLDLGGWKSPGARPDFGYSLMILLARTGRLAEARQVAASLSPDDQDQWSVTRDTLGVPALPEDEGLRALWRAPEYRALVEGQHARQQALFERYRPIVARFLAEEPDLPRPRTTWPAN